MSRSKPTNDSPNPSKRWFEWSGEKGVVRWYDKEAKENVTEDFPFTFMLLDQLATVKGWHEPSESGIYANEVKDTRSEPLVVKAFKGGILAEGFYKTIRDRIVALGGHFVANCYIAWRDIDGLKIGSLQFKGAALRSWMDFSKENRLQLFQRAIRITGFEEGKKGSIKFRTPTFSLIAASEEGNNQAMALDAELQEYLTGYFGRPKVEQSTAVNGQEQEEPAPPAREEPDEIPF